MTICWTTTPPSSPLDCHVLIELPLSYLKLFSFVQIAKWNSEAPRLMSDLGPAPTVFDNVVMNREDLNSNEAHEDMEDDSSSLLVNHFPLFDNSVLGAIQKIRVRFINYFRPLPPPVWYLVFFFYTPPP